MRWSTRIVLGLVISFSLLTCNESDPDVAMVSVVDILPPAPLDSTLPDQLRYADSLILWRDFDEASDSISQYLRSEPDIPLHMINRAKNLWCYAVLRSDTADIQGVLKVLTSLKNTDSAVDTLMAGERAMNLGLYYQEKEDQEKAVVYFDEALTSLTRFYGRQHPSMQRYYRDIGSFYYFDLGYVEYAFDLFNKEEALHRQWMYPPRDRMLNAYNLGVIYRDLEEFDFAEKYQHQAIAAIRGTELIQSGHAIFPYSSLCYLYANQNDAERLHQYVDTTLGLVKTYLKTDTSEYIDYLTTLALCYIPGNVDEPNRGLAILDQVPHDAMQLIQYRLAFAEVYRTRAYLNLGKGNLDGAQESMLHAIHLYQSVPKLNPYYKAGYTDALLGLGVFYIDDGKQAAKAMPYIHEAAKLLLDLPFEEFVGTYPVRYLKYFPRWYDYLLAYGDQLLYEEAPSPDVIRGMMALSTRIDGAIASTRQKVSNHDVLRNAELNHDIYTYMIEWCYALARMSGDDAIMQQAFDHMEKSRGHLLLTQLSTSKLAMEFDVPQSVIEEGERLTKEELITVALLDKTGTDSLLAKKQRYFQMLEERYPDYYHKSYKPDRATLPQIRSAMHNDDAMICYQLRDSNLYALIITTDTTVLLRTHFNTLCHESVEHLYNLVSVRPSNDWYTKDVEYLGFAATAFQCALKDAFPLIREKKHWWIAADGVLELLPFEILLTHRDSNDQSSADVPYLVKSYDIGYVLSSTTWFNETQKNAPLIDRVVAFIHSDGIHSVRSSEVIRDVSQFQGMPGTAKAAASIRKVYGSANVSIYENSKATTSAFMSALNNYDAFHLGLHAFADTTVRQQHGIVFPGDNAVLTVPEIVGSKIHASLVFLEGCETGVGKQARGEGILNFARPFIAAGTRHVLASRWKLHDQTAGLMSGYFYQQLKVHGNIPRANCEAKRMFLNQAKRIQSHPYYWAAVMSVQ